MLVYKLQGSFSSPFFVDSTLLTRFGQRTVTVRRTVLADSYAYRDFDKENKDRTLLTRFGQRTETVQRTVLADSYF